MIDDGVGELVGNVVGAVVEHAGGFVVDLTMQHIFSRHTARFFHGIGRRAIAVATLSGKRIPTSLRLVPTGARPKVRRWDWIALWMGVFVWVALFVVVGVTTVHLL